MRNLKMINQVYRSERQRDRLLIVYEKFESN